MNYGPASKYYDLFTSSEDIDFFKELSIKHGRKALELGVGTGRVAIELAKADVTIWGVDNSRYMLEVARRKLEDERVSVKNRVTLKSGDMRQFKLVETFPFIYIASSTFEHCITEEDQKKCFTSVYKTLEKKGVFAFDISQPMAGSPESTWWVDRRELGADEEVVRTIFSNRNSQTNVVSVNLFFDVYRNGKLKERYYEYGLAKITSKTDVERLLKKVGFEITAVYGGFDKSAYDKKSPRAIFIARKS